ncbi:BrnT family toxin [Variovorax sp. UMC13]|uniref:BrnT family toxin n=1 Tax=Variovorax sp. UMC13 TaxID=1862326 RepID=UPI0015FF6317|nr:BrnT family toxin [Variovorax sp. UMC13]MBB1603336.1 hypothetical protein [Variovorax sp. UMC13]
MRYSFDPAKLAVNVAKHGVWFSAAEDFEWESALVAVDSRKAYAEARLTAVGLIGERLHVMVFNLRDTTVRLISLRRANSREVKRYVDHS